MTTTTAVPQTVTTSSIPPCPHCNAFHRGLCPKVKAIECHPNGTVKRVEYR